MKLAETVTFGGSGLDRAAHLRGQAQDLAGLAERPDAEAIVFWRGKPLMRRGDWDVLARLPMSHPAFQEVRDTAIFLGRITTRRISGPDRAASS
jgi:NAD+ diphosphatase